MVFVVVLGAAGVGFTMVVLFSVFGASAGGVTTVVLWSALSAGAAGLTVSTRCSQALKSAALARIQIYFFIVFRIGVHILDEG